MYIEDEQLSKWMVDGGNQVPHYDKGSDREERKES